MLAVVAAGLVDALVGGRDLRRDGRRPATTAATTGTTTSQKTQRHDQVVVTQAAIGGPSSDGSTHAAEITLNTLGRNDSG